MKLLCIDDRWETVPGYEKPKRSPKFNEVCTVAETSQTPNGIFYSLVGYWPEDHFHSSGFVRIDDMPDETERSAILETEINTIH